MGYIELHLQILQVVAFKKDVLMLVVNDSRYIDRVPRQVGTIHIDMLIDLVTEEKLENPS